MKSLSILGPICSESSLKFKFLRAGDFLSVFFWLFTKIMSSATDSYLNYVTGIECTHDL